MNNLLIIITLILTMGACLSIVIAINCKHQYKNEIQYKESLEDNIATMKDKINTTGTKMASMKEDFDDLNSETYEMELFIQKKLCQIETLYHRIYEICISRGYPRLDSGHIGSRNKGPNFEGRS